MGKEHTVFWVFLESLSMALFFYLLILEVFVDRYLSWFYAQEASHWRQEEGLEEEEKVSIYARIYFSAIWLTSFFPISLN